LGALRLVTASDAGFFINLVPLFALGGAYVLLGERLTLAQWAGCGLVLLAVVGLSLGQNSGQPAGIPAPSPSEPDSTVTTS
jgi:drug/metabolite transporter (DMT)-like permease